MHRLITLGVFIGLTLFTYQSKYDFSGMGPWLFGGLVAMSKLDLKYCYLHCTKWLFSHDRSCWNVHSF